MNLTNVKYVHGSILDITLENVGLFHYINCAGTRSSSRLGIEPASLSCTSSTRCCVKLMHQLHSLLCETRRCDQPAAAPGSRFADSDQSAAPGRCHGSHGLRRTGPCLTSVVCVCGLVLCAFLSCVMVPPVGVARSPLVAVQGRTGLYDVQKMMKLLRDVPTDEEVCVDVVVVVVAVVAWWKRERGEGGKEERGALSVCGCVPRSSSSVAS